MSNEVLTQRSEERALLSPGAIAERRHIQEILRRIAARYRREGGVIEEVAIRRAIEEIFDARLEERAE